MRTYRPSPRRRARRRGSRALVALVGAVALLASLASLSSPSYGQGILIEVAPHPLPRVIYPPRRPIPPIPPRVDAVQYSITSEEIDANISGSVAQVNVSQTFKNEGSGTIEASFVFPIPYDGAVDSMTLLVNGKELPAKLLDADKARKEYEEIVRKAKDPALLEWLGQGMVKTSVFPIPAGESRTVSMRYTQLLRVKDGLTEFLFPLSGAKYTTKPIEKLSVSVAISADAEIKNVYSPTYDLKIERNGKTRVVASASLEKKVPNADFRLFFDQNADELSAKIQSYRPDENDDGYFLLLASPKLADVESKPLPKTVVFALDVSGSMSGKKIEQARDSLKFVLSRLRDDDQFNIVLFNGDVTTYKDELQVSNAETRADALNFVSATRAGGSTNIGAALERALGFFSEDDSSPKYFILLSDGEAVTGETNEMKLAEIARTRNKAKARVFTFGLGYNVHSRLMDRLSADGRGQGEYVKEDENIEESIARLYSRIEAPVFSDVAFEYALKDSNDARFTNRVYPSGTVDVFSGDQLVLAGRYAKSGTITITAKGRVGDETKEFQYEGELTAKSADASYAFVERIWANRRVAEIIDELDLKGENKELIDELVELSKKHGILTPYTSFLADENVDLNAATNAETATRQFDSLASQTTNMSGFAQRSFKQGLRNAQNLSSANAERAMGMNSMAMSAAPEASPATSGSFGGGMGGAARLPRGARVLAYAPTATSGMGGGLRSAASDLAKDASDASSRMRNVGDKTFYLKNGRWVDSSITDEMRKSQKPIQLKQFSDEYFQATTTNGQNFSQYLVFTEPVDLNYNGQIYTVEIDE